MWFINNSDGDPGITCSWEYQYCSCNIQDHSHRWFQDTRFGVSVLIEACKPLRPPPNAPSRSDLSKKICGCLLKDSRTKIASLMINVLISLISNTNKHSNSMIWKHLTLIRSFLVPQKTWRALEGYPCPQLFPKKVAAMNSLSWGQYCQKKAPKGKASESKNEAPKIQVGFGHREIPLLWSYVTILAIWLRDRVLSTCSFGCSTRLLARMGTMNSCNAAGAAKGSSTL